MKTIILISILFTLISCNQEPESSEVVKSKKEKPAKTVKPTKEETIEGNFVYFFKDRPTCNAKNQGIISYDASVQQLEFCDGESYRSLHGTPGAVGETGATGADGADGERGEAGSVAPSFQFPRNVKVSNVTHDKNTYLIEIENTGSKIVNDLELALFFNEEQIENSNKVITQIIPGAKATVSLNLTNFFFEAELENQEVKVKLDYNDRIDESNELDNNYSFQTELAMGKFDIVASRIVDDELVVDYVMFIHGSIETAQSMTNLNSVNLGCEITATMVDDMNFCNELMQTVFPITAFNTVLTKSFDPTHEASGDAATVGSYITYEIVPHSFDEKNFYISDSSSSNLIALNLNIPAVDVDLKVSYDYFDEYFDYYDSSWKIKVVLENLTEYASGQGSCVGKEEFRVDFIYTIQTEYPDGTVTSNPVTLTRNIPYQRILSGERLEIEFDQYFYSFLFDQMEDEPVPMYSYYDFVITGCGEQYELSSN